MRSSSGREQEEADDDDDDDDDRHVVRAVERSCRLRAAGWTLPTSFLPWRGGDSRSVDEPGEGGDGDGGNGGGEGGVEGGVTRRVTGLAHSRGGVCGQPESPPVGDHSRSRDGRGASDEAGHEEEDDEDDGDQGGDLAAGGAGDEGDDGGDSETSAADREVDGDDLGDAERQCCSSATSTMPTRRGDSTRCFLVLGSAMPALVV